MAKPTQEALRALHRSHEMYGDYLQTERAGCVFMAANGHPHAVQYRRLRAFFDRLRYASNSTARFFSYGDANESTEYWAPELKVTWYPTGELARFGHVYPARDDWQAYLQAAAAVSWRGASPSLFGGSWIVRTRDATFKDALLSLLAEVLGTDQTRVHADETPGGPVYNVRVYLDDNVSLHTRIVRLVREHHREFVLPQRKPEHDAADRAVLPLSQKKFSLGKVTKVTVTDRHVLVPLIPFGEEGAVVADAVAELCELMQKGFPFAQAKDWLQSALAPESFEQLAARFAEPLPVTG